MPIVVFNGPTIDSQSFLFPENSPADFAVGVVVATPQAAGATVVGFVWGDTETDTSINGYFRIGPDGTIYLTALGAATPSVNDYELARPPGVYQVEAIDNFGTHTNFPSYVTIGVSDVVETTPQVGKPQGLLPVYDPLRKQILGAYLMDWTHNFTGEETEHNLGFPNPSDASNTVQVMKVTPENKSINNQRLTGGWFMAAVFTHAEIRDKAYRGYKGYYDIDDIKPTNEWICCHSHPNQSREYTGPVIMGIERTFETGKDNETTYIPL
jgi:hypothetical protein